MVLSPKRPLESSNSFLPKIGSRNEDIYPVNRSPNYSPFELKSRRHQLNHSPGSRANSPPRGAVTIMNMTFNEEKPVADRQASPKMRPYGSNAFY